MSYQIDVISKMTRVSSTQNANSISLNSPSIVKLHLSRTDIASLARDKNDMVITLQSGEKIVVKNFYVTNELGTSQLVLEDNHGALWWVESSATGTEYKSIASIDELLATPAESHDGVAAWPWILGGLGAVAGGVAIAAGSSGGGHGGSDNDTSVDTTAPDAPGNLKFSPDGSTLTGTAEPGSTVTVTDKDGNALGTARTGPDGSFTLTLEPPQKNGETVDASATDPSNNTGPSASVTAPDITPPATPSIGAATDDAGSETGTLTNGQSTDDTTPTLSGTGNAGDVITVYDNGTAIGSTTVGSDGSWSMAPSTPLGEGNHALTVTATDPTGNTSA
ncbi:BapA/Bap/LapF family prefix-like domain-containing protein, partial [Trabulsiella odontotermitis]|uniref:BapA/Bap/LapF family prefix-like domain-containing protein n=1 Tax=Trabulsiella odontotermitis TaxID=379893 RepID=UPI0006A04077